MNRRNARALLAALVALALAASGCNSFHDRVTENGVTETTFDETLPDGLEEVYGTCSDPIVLDDTTTEIDLLGGCEYADMVSLGAQEIFLGLSLSGPIELADPVFPTDLAPYLSDIFLVEDFPWPVQNCKVFIEFDMDFGQIELTDLRSDWTTRGGLPALHLDFDFTPYYDPFTASWRHTNDVDIAEGEIDSEVDCPNPLNELVFAGALPEGQHEIELRNVDLDLWVKLDHDGGTDVSATLKVRVNMDGIDLEPALSGRIQDAVGSFEDILADASQFTDDRLDLTVGGLEDMMEDELEDAMADVAGQVETLVESAVPDGHEICSLSVENGELVLVTDEAGSRMQCFRTVRVQTFPRF